MYWVALSSNLVALSIKPVTLVYWTGCLLVILMFLLVSPVQSPFLIRNSISLFSVAATCQWVQALERWTCAQTTPGGGGPAGAEEAALIDRGHDGWYYPCMSRETAMESSSIHLTSQCPGMRGNALSATRSSWQVTRCRCHMDIHKGSSYPCSKCHKSLALWKTLGSAWEGLKRGH